MYFFQYIFCQSIDKIWTWLRYKILKLFFIRFIISVVWFLADWMKIIHLISFKWLTLHCEFISCLFTLFIYEFDMRIILLGDIYQLAAPHLLTGSKKMQLWPPVELFSNPKLNFDFFLNSPIIFDTIYRQLIFCSRYFNGYIGLSLFNLYIYSYLSIIYK